ncbi:hypothetical protein CU097_010221 [Rhizopus azygosporus]|uniref:OTU domain-containing protein n=1 Tax=Rhizopus azygosporus TaxID=86630 RepID=A0A367JDR8_RHIAZ|nr:hypothetical protein CU097_010221 [Rhizopus azygosporus]
MPKKKPKNQRQTYQIDLKYTLVLNRLSQASTQSRFSQISSLASSSQFTANTIDNSQSIISNNRLLSPKQIFEIIDPSIKRQAILSVYNVQSDSNCDFRAIEEHLKSGENNWKSVKTDMLKHLKSKLEFCSKHLHMSGPQPDLEKWFTIPDCAMVACNTYNVAIAVHSSEESSLFIPLFNMPVTVKSLVLQLSSRHFYFVRLKPHSRYQSNSLSDLSSDLSIIRIY